MPRSFWLSVRGMSWGQIAVLVQPADELLRRALGEVQEAGGLDLRGDGGDVDRQPGPWLR